MKLFMVALLTLLSTSNALASATIWEPKPKLLIHGGPVGVIATATNMSSVAQVTATAGQETIKPTMVMA